MIILTNILFIIVVTQVAIAGLSMEGGCLKNFEDLHQVKVILPGINRIVSCSDATVIFNEQTLTSLICFESGRVKLDEKSP